MDRRRALHLVLGLGGVGCAAPPDDAAPAPALSDALLRPWREVDGGFLTPPAAPGAPLRPGSGMYVRLVAPAAIALRGPDLLVADPATQRLWRLDPALRTASAIAGAPVTPQTALALGPDLSAWVLDAPARQLLRFARDGRLLQTWRVGASLAQPSGFALADGGASLLVADAGLAQWIEQRSAGGLVQSVQPRGDGARHLAGAIDAIALGPAGAVFVLDRSAGVVHRCTRDGRVLATLGRGVLEQPGALAVDRAGRVFVIDRAGGALLMLRDDAEPERRSAAQLGMQRLAGLAIDDSTLALSDALTGRVTLWRLT